MSGDFYHSNKGSSLATGLLFLQLAASLLTQKKRVLKKVKMSGTARISEQILQKIQAFLQITNLISTVQMFGYSKSFTIHKIHTHLD